MTAIAGLVHEGKVYIGGDSASAGGWDIRTSKVEKVFTNGPFLMGFTSSWRMGQLLRYALHVPEKDECQSVDQYMVTVFVDAVRETLKAGGFATKANEQESGGSFLVGYRGRLFEVASDYQVNENACGYAAVGCGENYALGALHALQGEKPESRVRKALAAAEEFSAGVRGPFIVRSI